MRRRMRPSPRYCVYSLSLRSLTPKAFFSLLDRAILNPDNAVSDARANPVGGTLDSLNFGFGRRGGLACFGLVVARFSVALSFHDRFFPRPQSSCASRSESDCCSG